MELIFNSSDKIGSIVAKFPKASEIFRENHIDFCCGGDRPLRAAIELHNPCILLGHIPLCHPAVYGRPVVDKGENTPDWHNDYMKWTDNIL